MCNEKECVSVKKWLEQFETGAVIICFSVLGLQILEDRIYSFPFSTTLSPTKSQSFFPVLRKPLRCRCILIGMLSFVFEYALQRGYHLPGGSLCSFYYRQYYGSKKEKQKFSTLFLCFTGSDHQSKFRFFFFFKILGFDSLGIFLRNIFKVIYSEALFIYVGSSMKIRSKGNKIKCGITSSSFLMLIEHRV